MPTPTVTRATAAAAALLSAGLTNLALPPLDLWPAGVVSLLPLIAVVARSAPRSAAIVGFLYGLATHAIGCRWIPAALAHGASSSPAMGIGALILFSGIQAIQPSCALALAAWCRIRGMSMVVAFPLALASSEVIFPQILPWSTALVVQAATPLMQLASVGGPILVTLALALFNAGIWFVCESVRAHHRRSAKIGGALTVAFAAFAVFGGTIRMRRLDRAAERATVIRILVIQPGRGTEPLDAARRLTLDALGDDAGSSPPSVVVWPETALGVALPIDDDAASRQFVRDSVFGDLSQRDERDRFSTPLLTGAVLETAKSPQLGRYNAAVLVNPDGARAFTYVKQHLAPVGETTPFEGVLPALRGIYPPVTSFTAGPASGPMRWDGHVMDLSICFEDILVSPFADRVRKNRPELLVNLTSDAWFGDSAASELHFALARFRAVEHARELLRVMTDGVTALVSSTGEVSRRLPARIPASAVVEAHWLAETTPFDHLGASPGWAVVLGTLALVLRAKARVACDEADRYRGLERSVRSGARTNTVSSCRSSGPSAS